MENKGWDTINHYNEKVILELIEEVGTWTMGFSQ